MMMCISLNMDFTSCKMYDCFCLSEQKKLHVLFGDLQQLRKGTGLSTNSIPLAHISPIGWLLTRILKGAVSADLTASMSIIQRPVSNSMKRQR